MHVEMACLHVKHPEIFMYGDLYVSCRIQSSYAALQRINQDLEDKMHRTVRSSQQHFSFERKSFNDLKINSKSWNEKKKILTAFVALRSSNTASR